MLFLAGYQLATLQNTGYVPTGLQLPGVRTDQVQPFVDRLQMAIVGIE